MSRASRSRGRSHIDFYPTPHWCTHRLLEAVDIPGGRWLEPCVGDGAIVDAVAEVRHDVTWTTVDIRSECEPDVVADFVALGCPDLGRQHFDAVVTNPPYSLAMDFLLEARRRAPVVAMLLRLNWLASAMRRAYLSANVPDVYVLPDRPCFYKRHIHGSDATDYAWMVWGATEASRGALKVLRTTPLAERRPTA